MDPLVSVVGSGSFGLYKIRDQIVQEGHEREVHEASD